uniref:Coiled-coil domain-containing protein 30 n=1 Tax=Pelusios castaneus TaxID=367368 RepID=A0A8C8SBU5_9SAUR
MAPLCFGNQSLEGSIVNSKVVNARGPDHAKWCPPVPNPELRCTARARHRTALNLLPPVNVLSNCFPVIFWSLDRTELQKAMEHNNRLDKEILALRSRVRTLDSERKVFLELVRLCFHIIWSLGGRELGKGRGCQHYLSGERLLQQHQEEMLQLRQDFNRVQNLFSSAEKELRYEREKNLDLKKHNILLQQENTKVKAELRQAQLKLTDSTKTCSSLTEQWEHSQQQLKELELELLKHSQIVKLQSSLQEKLVLEKSRAADAEKKVNSWGFLKYVNCVSVITGNSMDTFICKSENHFISKIQNIMKLLDQQAEELKQQLRHAHETETSLAKTHAELQVRFQQQEAQLHVLEDEKKTVSSEQLHCQKANQNLSEQLSLLQQEKETLHEEYDRLLKQLDIYSSSDIFHPNVFLGVFLMENALMVKFEPDSQKIRNSNKFTIFEAFDFD